MKPKKFTSVHPGLPGSFLTVVFTDHPPVDIIKDKWPVIAHGSYKNHDIQEEFQERRWEAGIYARQHNDERVLVYGIYEHHTSFHGESCFSTRAGEMPKHTREDIIEAITLVGKTMVKSAESAGFDFKNHINAAVRDCINNLPQEQKNG
jgi:hypothetical protein